MELFNKFIIDDQTTAKLAIDLNQLEIKLTNSKGTLIPFDHECLDSVLNIELKKRNKKLVPLKEFELIPHKENDLMWAIPKEKLQIRNWKQATDYCHELKLAGFDNWRLPTINDLLTLVNYNTSDPACLIKGIKPETYWSSTVYEGDNTVWGVDFEKGNSRPILIFEQYTFIPVRKLTGEK